MMKTEKQILISPLKGLLQLEVMQLMREGWGVYDEMKLVWSWRRLGYIYKITMVKDNRLVEIEKMEAAFFKHLDELKNAH